MKYLLVTRHDNEGIGVEVAVDWTTLERSSHPLGGRWQMQGALKVEESLNSMLQAFANGTISIPIQMHGKNELFRDYHTIPT